MSQVDRLLDRQARWQRSRRTLSWPEKIRLAERIRPTVEAFRLQRERRAAHGAPEQSATSPSGGPRPDGSL